MQHVWNRSPQLLAALGSPTEHMQNVRNQRLRVQNVVPVVAMGVAGVGLPFEPMQHCNDIHLKL